MRLDMEVKPALCPAHRSLLPDGKQLILYSSTALSQSLLRLFPILFPRHSQEACSQKFGNAFPTAWEMPPGKIVADSMFAWPRPPLAGVSELALADWLVT